MTKYDDASCDDEKDTTFQWPVLLPPEEPPPNELYVCDDYQISDVRRQDSMPSAPRPVSPTSTNADDASLGGKQSLCKHQVLVSAKEPPPNEPDRCKQYQATAAQGVQRQPSSSLLPASRPVAAMSQATPFASGSSCLESKSELTAMEPSANERISFKNYQTAAAASQEPHPQSSFSLLQAPHTVVFTESAIPSTFGHDIENTPGAVSVPGPSASTLHSYDSASPLAPESESESEHETTVLAEAMLVEEPAADSIIAEEPVAAASIVSEGVAVVLGGRQLWLVMIGTIIVLFVFALITAVTVTVLLVGRNDKNGGASSEPPSKQTPAPTIGTTQRQTSITSSEDRFETIKNIIMEGLVSDRTALESNVSPQYKAANWLATQDVARLSLNDTARVIQRYVLAVIYYSTEGDSWSQQYGFLSGRHECDWRALEQYEHVDGVGACDGSARVTELHLATYIAMHLIITLTLPTTHEGSNRLSGSIPREVGSLTRLTWLDLWENSALEGSLPHELTNLKLLTHLGIYNCNLSGTIHSDLGQLTALVDIVIGYNNLRGPIPTQLGLLTQLTALALLENDLSGSIPYQLGSSLSKLEHLWLDHNHLTGAVPQSFANLTEATKIHLQDNNLTGSVDILCDALPETELWVDRDEVDCKCCECCHPSGES